MASIKVKFRPSSVNNREGTIYYQVIHERVIRQIRTEYRVFREEWNMKAAAVRRPLPENRRNYLQAVEAGIRMDVERMRRIISDFLTGRPDFTADELVAEFTERTGEQSFFNFMQGRIIQLKSQGNQRTSETYTATLHSFKDFLDGKDVQFDRIDTDLAEAYENWLKNRGICSNTISFYMRILRAVYNRGWTRGLPGRTIRSGMSIRAWRRP